jgi:aspartyl/asparaginyl beta-hydroxylase (cupin superfamily)
LVIPTMYSALVFGDLQCFHEAGTILAKWDAIGDQASGLKSFYDQNNSV